MVVWSIQDLDTKWRMSTCTVHLCYLFCMWVSTFFTFFSGCWYFLLCAQQHASGYSIVAKSLGSESISVQFSSVTQLCPTLCDPMIRSTPGLPVHHQLLEFTQTHVHRVGDAIQPSHPLSSPSHDFKMHFHNLITFSLSFSICKCVIMVPTL